jgi:hypothetical protein
MPAKKYGGVVRHWEAAVPNLSSERRIKGRKKVIA